MYGYHLYQVCGVYVYIVCMCDCMYVVMEDKKPRNSNGRGSNKHER